MCQLVVSRYDHLCECLSRVIDEKPQDVVGILAVKIHQFSLVIRQTISPRLH